MPMEDAMRRWTATCPKCKAVGCYPIVTIPMVYCLECGAEIYQEEHIGKDEVKK